MIEDVRLALLFFLLPGCFSAIAQPLGPTDSVRAEGFLKNDDLANWLTVFTDQANALYDSGQPFEAMEVVEKAVSTPFRPPKTTVEWKKMAGCRNLQSWFAETGPGDFELAKKYLNHSWQIWNDHLRLDFDAGFYILKNLGNILSRLGDFERAELLLTEAQKMTREKGDFSNAAFAASDLSIVFQCRNELKKAISTAADALRLPEIDAENRAYLFSNLAKCYRLTGQLSLAEKAVMDGFQQLPEIADQEIRNSLRAEFFSSQGEIFVALKKLNAAEKAFKTALFWSKKYYQTDYRREIGKIHIALGDLFLKQKNGRKALAEFQVALHSVVKNFRADNPDLNPIAEQFYPENTIAEALAGKARAWQLEFDRTRQSACLEKALACHDLRLNVEDRLRQTYQFESSSLQALDQSRELLEQAVEIAWQLFDATTDLKYARRAFDFAERSKGLLLLQSLAKAKSDFRLPPELRNREQELNSRIAFLEKQIFEEKTARESGPDHLADLQLQLLKIKQTREKFRVELKKTFPDYERLSREIAFVKASEILLLLRDGQAMAEYLVGEHSLFVFFFEKNGQFSLRKTSIPADFAKDVDSLRAFLSRYDNSVEARNHFVGLSRKMYELLLGPELRAIRQQPRSLLFAPDGELGFIPFEILLESENGQSTGLFRWKNLPFLLKKCPISYAWSATLLREQQQTKPPENLRRLAGFAPSYSSTERLAKEEKKQPVVSKRGADDMDLPGAQVEMDLLDNLIGGDFFRNGLARKTDFVREARGYRVLHLAMHARTNNENPAFSHLVFTPEPGDRSDANCLFVNELQQISLFAELAVLSACHTGDGRLHRGEGVFSLGRAFALAGVPATLMSFRELPDESAPDLIRVFYENLKAGKTKDESLQLAKLAWLDGSRPREFEHPFLWSGLVANGKMDPIELQPEFPIFGFAVVFIALAALFLWIAGRRKKEKLPSPPSRF